MKAIFSSETLITTYQRRETNLTLNARKPEEGEGHEALCPQSVKIFFKLWFSIFEDGGNMFLRNVNNQLQGAGEVRNHHRAQTVTNILDCNLLP
jgi:hypothetical protein